VEQFFAQFQWRIPLLGQKPVRLPTVAQGTANSNVLMAEEFQCAVVRKIGVYRVLSASLHGVGGCRIFSSVRAFRGQVMACGTTG